MNVRVARQLRIQDAEDGRVKAVLVLIELAQYIEDGVHLGDDLVVVAVLRGLGHHRARRLRREVAGKIRLCTHPRCARAPKRLAAALPNVEADRLRCDRNRVEVRGCVDP